MSLLQVIKRMAGQHKLMNFLLLLLLLLLFILLLIYRKWITWELLKFYFIKECLSSCILSTLNNNVIS